MSEEIKSLYEDLWTTQRRLEEGVVLVRDMQRKLERICPHKWVDGFMFSICEWCGAES